MRGVGVPLSLRPRLTWRISAASVAGSPILIIAFAAFCGNIGARVGGWTTKLGTTVAIVELLTVITLIVFYVIARIVLLVLPCIGHSSRSNGPHFPLIYAELSNVDGLKPCYPDLTPTIINAVGTSSILHTFLPLEQCIAN